MNKLKKSKFGAKNKDGVIFKWLPYGNLHHVEILRDKVSGEYSGKFVTMMEANHRVKGINKAKQSVIQTEQGDDHEFVMALHINDLVSIGTKNNRRIYRIQLLDSPNKRINLRLHTAANLKNVHETLPDRDMTIPALMKAGMSKLQINAIGKPVT